MEELPRPLVDWETARGLLETAAPVWADFLDALEDSDGRLTFRPEFISTIANLGLDSYPLLYEHEAAAGKLLARAVFGSEAEAVDKELKSATPEERGATLKELGRALALVEEAVDFSQTSATKAQSAEGGASLSAEDQDEAAQFMPQLLMGVLVVFYEQLSVMVHGEKLTALVARAKGGDDEAFLKAIQIDKAILAKVPFFADRYLRAQRAGERSFVTAVSRKLEAAPYVGKIGHKKLWLAFSLLDALGLLDSVDANGLLDMLLEVGVVDDERPIDDVKNLLKLKARYREFQARGGMSTP